MVEASEAVWTSNASHKCMPEASVVAEKTIVESNLCSPNAVLVCSDTWYVVCQQWYERWNMYISSSGEAHLHPGPMSTKTLAHPTIRGGLRAGVQEGADFIFMAKEGFAKLAATYGTEEGAAFPRKVVNRGTAQEPNLVIALYPVLVHLYALTNTSPHAAAPAQLNTEAFASLAMEPDSTLKDIFEWYGEFSFGDKTLSKFMPSIRKRFPREQTVVLSKTLTITRLSMFSRTFTTWPCERPMFMFTTALRLLRQQVKKPSPK